MGGFPRRRDRSAAAAAVQRGRKNDGFMDELHFYKVGSPRHPGKIHANFSPFALNEVAFMQITTSSFFVLGPVFSFYTKSL